MGTIGHHTAASGTDSGDGKISKNAWNETHDFTLGIADITSLQSTLDGKAAAGEIACAAQTVLYYNTNVNHANEGIFAQETGNFVRHNLMQFSLSGVPTIKKAWLEVVILDWNGCFGQNEGINQWMKVQRMLRTDINYAQADWTVYKTGSNWATAGGTGASDRTKDGVAMVGPFPTTAFSLTPTGAVVDRRVFDLTEIVRACQAASQSNVDVMLNATATSGQNTVTMASRTDGTAAYKPRIIYLA